MIILLKSKIYREEILRILLIGTLMLWASFATALALQNKERTLIIGIDDGGSPRVISGDEAKLTEMEFKMFLKDFLKSYYTFDESTFDQTVGHASDLMNVTLWDEKKSSLLELKTKLQKEPLSQTVQIESLDLISEGEVEAILNVQIRSKLQLAQTKVKVKLQVVKRKRSERNPWMYEVKELSDAAL